MNIKEIKQHKHIHFIGIGGISMSGLAEILVTGGCKVSGSDMRESTLTRKLAAGGITVFIGHDAKNIAGADLIVYNTAIKTDNPELAAAIYSGVSTIDRASLLGAIMEDYKWSIAVSGTHGKTTTTSMISMIMLEEGLDPTIHIGGEIEAIGGTTRAGKSAYFVAEACEYYESFLKFNPYIAVILNIDYDHADYFRDIAHVRETFLKFAEQVPDNGFVIYDSSSQTTTELLKHVKCRKITFGLGENADWSAKDILYDENGCASYQLLKEGTPAGIIKLNVPGRHNVLDSLAAIAACSIINCGFEAITDAMKKFKGAHRRFELKGVVDGIRVIDDYAHHPSEIKATLGAAASFKQSGIWCIFQPHTYTRTKSFMADFATSFGDAGRVIVTDIYAAREPDTGEVNSEMLVEKIRSNNVDAIYIKSFEDIAKYLKENALSGEMIITMGAGDIYKVADLFLR